MSKFKVGDRVLLNHMGHTYHHLPEGIAGVVFHVRPEELSPGETQGRFSYLVDFQDEEFAPWVMDDEIEPVDGPDGKQGPDGVNPWGDIGQGAGRVWQGVKDLDVEERTTPFELSVDRILDHAKTMLVEKHKSYGRSALDPVRIFANSDRMEQLYVRLDDKLARVKNGHEYPGDDTLMDILGYVTLILVARETE